MRPIQVVVTPGSGNGRAMHMALELQDALRVRGYQARLEVFADLESLAHWARGDGPSFSLLVCIGGDGTLCAAAEAAVRRAVPFLPVPTGFGNLFPRALGHSPRVERVIELLQRGKTIHVDVGVRNGKLFLCQESFGFLSEIQARAEASLAEPRPRWRRWLAYYVAAVRHFRDAPLTSLQVGVDGRVVAREAAVVTVANVATYGPWLRLTPEASPVDGQFDVFVMHEASKRTLLAGLLRRHLGIPASGRGWLLCRARRVSIGAPRSAPDELELIPGLLPVVVSPEMAGDLEQAVPGDGRLVRVGRGWAG
jgi:diacylglycerol kinase (ATP)